MDDREANKLRVVVDGYDSLIQLHRTACDMARELMVRKNKDYTDGEDIFNNLHDGGAYGILVRLGDKHKRLLNFERRALADPKHILQISDELVEDTVIDLINYSILYLGYKRRRILK